jgi:hypothetical protein
LPIDRPPLIETDEDEKGKSWPYLRPNDANRSMHHSKKYAYQYEWYGYPRNLAAAGRDSNHPEH